MDQPLDIVIVSYRCEELLRDCLESLVAHPPSRGARVIVVDNDSGDGTAEMVERNFPEAELVRADRNLGFAAASNLGVRRGDGKAVLFLNPDTRVEPGTLDTLLELLDARPEVGICGPKLVRDDGGLDHAAKRSFPTILGALGHFSGFGRHRRAIQALAQYRAPGHDPDAEGPVDAVNGAFMLARRDLLQRIGAFDEGYWMYMEDLDLCFRAVEAGAMVWYEPAAVAWHHKAGTSGPVRSVRLEVAFHYGMLRFYRKHRARQAPFPVNTAVYAGIAIRLALMVALIMPRRISRAVLAAVSGGERADSG